MPERRVLVGFDTDHVKEYVFATPRLKEIRAASSILDDLNQRETPERLAAVLGHPVKFDPTTWLGLIYNNGGSGLLLVKDEQEARAAVEAVQVLYREKTRAASISAVYCTVSVAELQENFAACTRNLALRMRAAKEAAAPPVSLPALPWLRVCASCGREAAAAQHDGELLCSACAGKHNANNRARFADGFCKYVKGTAEDVHARWQHGRGVDPILPEFDDIGAVGGGGDYIGLVYCDGNAMAKALTKLRTLGDYREFARIIDEATREVTYETLAELLSITPDNHLPFEILLMGGDDLLVVLPARQALRFATRVAERFQQKTAAEFSRASLGLRHATLSAGVVITHARFPIRAALELASDLLRSAKHVATADEGGIDFAVVTSSVANTIEHVRARELTRKQADGTEVVLTQRPYTLTQAQRLLDHAAALQAMPTAQLARLYDALFTSRVDACLQTMLTLGRLGEKAEPLRMFLETLDEQRELPFQRRGERFITPLADVIEIMEFVEGRKRG